MLKHVAVRLKKPAHADFGFSQKRARIVNYFIEKRDPALKNFTEGLYTKGLKFSWADNFPIKNQQRRIDYDASLQRAA